MFYFKITERQKNGPDRRTSRDHYREYLRPSDLGSTVAAMTADRLTTSVSVTKISQAAYVRATRTD
jgi:hypothetical protein